MFRLNRNKQKTNWNSLIGSIFCYFLQKFSFFSIFSVCFETVCFGCFASIPKTERFDWTKTNRRPTKQWKESIYGNFSENLGLFRFVTKQICSFRLFRYRFCSARDWDRIRITWGNPQSGCSDICSYSKRATVGVRAPYATKRKLRYEANQVWMNTTFISQGPQSSGI